MNIVCLGITYHDCPVEAREKVALSGDEQQAGLEVISNCRSVTEGLILDTCNRTEFYLRTKDGFDYETFAADLIEQIKPKTAEAWKKYHHCKTGKEAVRHLFTVACGLDSQVLGENQIVGQLKSAYRQANEAKISKFFFHRLMHTAFRVSKRVRTETDICCGAVSVSLAAVSMARSQTSLPGEQALIVGAGENAAVAAKYLLKEGIGDLVIANRNAQTADEMTSQLKTGKVIGLDDIPEYLSSAAVVICSTASAEAIITLENSRLALDKRTGPLVIIDVAVPRDVEEAIAGHKWVKLYNIDDLNCRIDENKKQREKQIPRAKAIIEEYTENFSQWFGSLDTAKIISALSQAYLAQAKEEAKRYARDFAPGDRAKLEIFSESLAKKILHGPITFLKSLNEETDKPDQAKIIDLINQMFLESDDSA